MPPFCHSNHFQLCEKKPPVHTCLWTVQAGESALPVRIVIGHLFSVTLILSASSLSFPYHLIWATGMTQ